MLCALRHGLILLCASQDVGRGKSERLEERAGARPGGWQCRTAVGRETGGGKKRSEDMGRSGDGVSGLESGSRRQKEELVEMEGGSTGALWGPWRQDGGVGGGQAGVNV